MSESNGTCIINVSNGIGNSTAQISKFTHNFDSIKFIADKDFMDYMVMIITDAGGRVNIVAEGENLKKEYNTENAQTELLWYPQREITCDDGVVIYQIAAYSAGDDKSVWYSKEGRLIVTDSIDTNDLSAELIGSSPNLITQILTSLKKTEADLQNAGNSIDIHSGAISGLTKDISDMEEDISRYKLSVHSGEEIYNPESNLAQSGKAVAQAVAKIVNSAPETLDTLEELAKALDNDPNFATTIMTLLGNKVEKDIFNNTVDEFIEDICIHKDNILNPHRVTKEQIGLSEVDNTSDKDKPVSDAVRDELNNKVDKVQGKGLSSNDFTDEYVDAINEYAVLIGNNSQLNTNVQDNLVDAINEVYDNMVDNDRIAYSVDEISDEYLEIPTVEVTKELINPTPVTETATTLKAYKQYNFGEVTTLNLAFPTVATDGDVIYLTFKSGTTPTALTIDTTNTSDIEVIPELNTGYEIFGKYNGEIWIVNYSEYTVSEV